ALAARVATRCVDDDAPVRLVDLGELGRALVLRGDRADLHLDDPAVLLALDFLQLRARERRRDSFDVEQHLPRVVDRGAHSEAVCDLHVRSNAARASGVSMSVGSPVSSQTTLAAPCSRTSTRAPSSPSRASAASQSGRAIFTGLPLT